MDVLWNASLSTTNRTREPTSRLRPASSALPSTESSRPATAAAANLSSSGQSPRAAKPPGRSTTSWPETPSFRWPEESFIRNPSSKRFEQTAIIWSRKLVVGYLLAGRGGKLTGTSSIFAASFVCLSVGFKNYL